MLISSQFKGIVIFALAVFAVAAHAVSSTNPRVMPQVGASQSYQANVNIDPKDCTDYLASSAYVITLGSGGTNMKLQCPSEKPVMIYWQQQLGFGGFPYVAAGGGQAWIRCCAISHSWQPVTPGANIHGIDNIPAQ